MVYIRINLIENRKRGERGGKVVQGVGKRTSCTGEGEFGERGREVVQRMVKFFQNKRGEGMRKVVQGRVKII